MSRRSPWSHERVASTCLLGSEAVTPNGIHVPLGNPTHILTQGLAPIFEETNNLELGLMLIKVCLYA